MLHPVDANYVNPKLKPNDLSCVLRVSNAVGSVLLTGDIEARTESDLIRREPPRAHATAFRSPGRPAPRQPDLVDAGVHRVGATGGRCIHPGVPQPFQSSA